MNKNCNLEEFFKNNTNFITHVQFRNALKLMNIGLTLNQIDEIINLTRNYEGMINWKDFCIKMNPSYNFI